MKNATFLKSSVALTGVAILSFAMPTQSVAKQYDMCQLETIPDNVLRNITKRADYGDILQQMVTNCPASALALTEAAIGAGPVGPKKYV